MECIHKKSGRQYSIIFSGVINATNAQDGQEMVVYMGKTKDEKSVRVFVREEKEFEEKFERIGPGIKAFPGQK